MSCPPHIIDCSRLSNPRPTLVLNYLASRRGALLLRIPVSFEVISVRIVVQAGRAFHGRTDLPQILKNLNSFILIGHGLVGRGDKISVIYLSRDYLSEAQL